MDSPDGPWGVGGELLQAGSPEPYRLLVVAGTVGKGSQQSGGQGWVSGILSPLPSLAALTRL